MIQTLGIGGLVVSDDSEDIIVTHSLGSCIGIVAHDSVACVGGMIHYKLPKWSHDFASHEKKLEFGDYAIPELFHTMYSYGASKKNIRTVMAGGSSLGDTHFRIGDRNILIARKLLWKNSVFIDAECVGGNKPRTLYLKMASGQTWYESLGEEVIL
ncbi:MAG: chemotaxis protein CheD [Fibrobacterales bacterium]